ncbi:MAG: TlyA family RNA methyltransferase [Nitrospinota bacterium]|nr:TlyA family RNA methyltransferase [Nitrospinota bacterium]MDH5678318.1 TlyA family RNA methyltransferase [Nitrospinota bacterium]MDH5757566.1 TlyA family RNA methyltransferase [Nitrospinota bacterium]
MQKKRLDALLVDLGLAPTRARAHALVLAGLARVDGRPADKPGSLVDVTCQITLKEKDHPYVSRGGVKLAAALDHFHVDPKGLICLDLGASTGGFTDLLLKKGATKVWAVDVGTNQLDYRLRTDPRVVCLEKTNARQLDSQMVTDRIDLLVADVSFISLRLVIPPALPLLGPGARMLLLVKPQFEAGRENVGKGGVVRDEAIRKRSVDQVRGFFEDMGLVCQGVIPSPIQGAKGNVEYFLCLINRQ